MHAVRTLSSVERNQNYSHHSQPFIDILKMYWVAFLCLQPLANVSSELTINK